MPEASEMTYSSDDALVAKRLFKVFGTAPQKAIEHFRQGLTKAEILERFGMTIGVSDASFSVRRGEIFVVMGLSGSGKSTLVRMLNRLIEPSAGEIVVNGNDIAKMSERELIEFRRRHISMVFQSFALMPHLNVIQNVAFGLELAGVDLRERERRAVAALEQVGLEAWSQGYPNELSGGMQQRVGLARALANDPSILLMDEAFSALDPLIRTEMQDELLKLQEEHQRTVIFISHDLDEAMRIGDRIAIMEGGRVVQIGTPDEILNNPADDYVRSFFRGVNVGNILTAADVARKRQVTVIDRDGNVRAVLNRIGEADRDVAYVVDKKQKFYGVVSVDSLETELKSPEPRLQSAFLANVEPLDAQAKISSIITTVARAPYGLPVVDANGHYMGVVSRSLLLEALSREDA